MATLNEMTGDASLLPQLTNRFHRICVPSLGLRMSERRLLLALVDILLVNAALLVAILLVTDLIPSIDALWLYGKWFVALTVVWLGSALFFDCYNLARSASTSATLRSTTAAVLTTSILYTFIPVVTPPLTSRGLIFYSIAFMLAAVLAWRIGYARLVVQPWFQQRALIVGAGGAGTTLVTALRHTSRDANPFRGTGYEIVGFIDDAPELQGAVIQGAPVLGAHAAMLDAVQAYGVSEVIVAITHRHAMAEELLDMLFRCRELGVRLVTMTTVYERLTGRVPLDHVGTDLSMVVPMDDDAGERAFVLMKRVVDVCFCLPGLALMGLAAPIVALINALSSPGALFYKQTRVGRGGKPFLVYKFRSMRPDAESGTGAVWARSGDDRITPFGRIMRRTRVDELPQFLNILRGEMSLIGPRPERPEFVDQLAQTIPFYRARHAVKPGITGWAQIRYRYGGSVDDSKVKLEYDLYYVKHASIFLDIVIMLQTLPVMLQFKGT